MSVELFIWFGTEARYHHGAECFREIPQTLAGILFSFLSSRSHLLSLESEAGAHAVTIYIEKDNLVPKEREKRAYTEKNNSWHVSS